VSLISAHNAHVRRLHVSLSGAAATFKQITARTLRRSAVPRQVRVRSAPPPHDPHRCRSELEKKLVLSGRRSSNPLPGAASAPRWPPHVGHCRARSRRACRRSQVAISPQDVAATPSRVRCRLAIYRVQEHACFTLGPTRLLRFAPPSLPGCQGLPPPSRSPRQPRRRRRRDGARSRLRAAPRRESRSLKLLLFILQMQVVRSFYSGAHFNEYCWRPNPTHSTPNNTRSRSGLSSTQ